MATAIVDAFNAQAEICGRLGSPFTAGVCRLLAERLDHSTRFGHKILDWPRDPVVDALPLRACGALHALARSWKEPELKAAFPPAHFDGPRLWHLIVDILSRHDNFCAGFLDSPPQTNEVARSAILLGAFLHLTAMTRLPIHLFEIGASGGLNLHLDAYRYHLGGEHVWGPHDSPLIIPCEWRGALPPLSVRLNIAARAACDRNPLDPAVEADRERLVAFVWPDQEHRLSRLEAALDLAAQSGVKVESADAGDWLERAFARPHEPGTCRLLAHTIVWQYMPDESKARVETALAKAAAAATDDTPVAHVAFEPDGRPDSGVVTLTVWPGGEPLALGRADFHGRWVEWEEV